MLIEMLGNLVRLRHSSEVVPDPEVLLWIEHRPL